jgi:hypothetical protein
MAAAFGLLQLSTDDFGDRGSEDEHSDQSNQEWLASRSFDPRGNRLSDARTGDDDGDGGMSSLTWGQSAPTTKYHPPGLGAADTLGARRQCSDAVYLRGAGG